jgi:hypothetical protein
MAVTVAETDLEDRHIRLVRAHEQCQRPLARRDGAVHGHAVTVEIGGQALGEEVVSSTSSR